MSKKILMTLVSLFLLLSVPWVSAGKESANFDLNSIRSYLYSFDLSDSYLETAKKSTFSFYADKISLGTFASAKYPSFSKKALAEKIDEDLIDPRRLFVIPVADVLRSMEVNIGGGTAFGVKKGEKRPILGHVRLGLGDVVEVEVSTLGIINRLSEGTASITTGAFKLKLLPEGKLYPALAGALRSSLWHTEIRNEVKFQRRLSTLYFVASKTLGKASVHAGVSISDLRIRTRTSDDVFITPTHEDAKKNNRDYINKNLYGPFLGLRLELNPTTFLMMEVEQIAEFNFDEENSAVSKDNIDARWMGIVGVRFFFFNWLAFDTGVMYRSDYYGIGDAHIEAGLNINISLPRIAKSLFGEK
jgi:hypothetical protein